MAVPVRFLRSDEELQRTSLSKSSGWKPRPASKVLYSDGSWTPLQIVVAAIAAAAFLGLTVWLFFRG